MRIPFLAYLSYDSDHDEKSKIYFVKQSAYCPTPFEIAGSSSDIPFDDLDWAAKAEEKIKNCNLVIVLLGRQTAENSQVVQEIALTRSHNIPCLGIYNENYEFYDVKIMLPPGLEETSIKYWLWWDIADALDNINQTRSG